GGVLDQLGISADGRVGTFAWNTARHLELYFAAPCSGRVLHTLNIPLFPQQITYVVNHAVREASFVDRSRLAALEPPLAAVRSSEGCSTSSGSPPTGASGPSRGTPHGTSSCTSRRPAAGGCCTR